MIRKYKLTYELIQLGTSPISENAPETLEFEVKGNSNFDISKKARTIASRYAKAWIETNCKPRLLAPGYIRKAHKWNFLAGIPQRVFQVMSGEIKLTLHEIFQ